MSIIKKDDITQIDCDAIINPAHSFVYIDGEVATRKIRKNYNKKVKDFEDSFKKIILIDSNKEVIDSFNSFCSSSISISIASIMRC